MRSLLLWLTYIMGAGMIVAGIVHFARTRSYLRIVPDFFPQRMLIVQLSGAIELLAGIGLFFPAFRSKAALVVLVLMIGFLPLHIWDVFRDRPAMGSKSNAIIRLALQFLLIGWAWFITFYPFRSSIASGSQTYP